VTHLEDIDKNKNDQESSSHSYNEVLAECRNIYYIIKVFQELTSQFHMVRPLLENLKKIIKTMISIFGHYAQRLGKTIVNDLLIRPLCLLFSSFVWVVDDPFIVDPKIAQFLQDVIGFPEAYPIR
jgi:hypothetical protein